MLLNCMEESRYRPLAPIHSFENIINYIYSKFQNDLVCIWAGMDQNMKQSADFAMYFY